MSGALARHGPRFPANGKGCLQVARLAGLAPWLCVPASRRVCLSQEHCSLTGLIGSSKAALRDPEGDEPAIGGHCCTDRARLLPVRPGYRADMNAITLLKNDHKTVEDLFQRFEKLGP